MKRLVLGVAAAALSLGLMLAAGTEAGADHKVSIKVRNLHSKSCVTNIETALKGKAAAVDKDSGTVTVTVPHTGPVNALDLIASLRAKGYEPISVVMNVGLDTKITLKSGGFGVRESQQELKDALSETGFLDVASSEIRGSVMSVPVSAPQIDVVKLLNAAAKAGFALSAVEVQGSPGTTTTVTAGNTGGLKQPVRDTCIVLAKAARLFTTYKGVQVPFCCKNCQGRFESLPDKEKDFAVRDAVERFGEERGGAKKTDTASAPAKLPTQAQLGTKCVILGEPGKANLTRTFQGLKVPLCCKNCQSEWDAMSDADKVKTLADAAKS
jgi:copper chaperone CopZ